MDVCVVNHPLAAARLTTLRDERTGNAAFRAALRDLTHMLVYEATRDAPSEEISVRTPLGPSATIAVAPSFDGPRAAAYERRLAERTPDRSPGTVTAGQAADHSRCTDSLRGRDSRSS
jgi:hypothetical protein